MRAALETTRGTAVNPTRILEQTDFSHDPDIITVRPEERRGSYFAHYRAAGGRERHEVSMEGNLSYNQAAWLGNLFVKGVTAGTETAVSSGAWRYTFLPASAADDLKTATLEFGYDTALTAGRPGWRLPYTVGDELTITFDKGNVDGVTFSADMHSPKAASTITAYGGTPTSIASTAVVPTNVAVYVDAATIGTTLDNSVTTAEWTLTNGWTDLDTLNQTTAAQDTFRVSPWNWSLDITRGPVTGSSSLYADYVSKALRKIRVRATGPTLGTANYQLTLDLYGTFTGYDNTSIDGLMGETLTFEPVYDATAATSFSYEVITAETTIT